MKTVALRDDVISGNTSSHYCKEYESHGWLSVNRLRNAHKLNTVKKAKSLNTIRGSGYSSKTDIARLLRRLVFLCTYGVMQVSVAALQAMLDPRIAFRLLGNVGLVREASVLGCDRVTDSF